MFSYHAWRKRKKNETLSFSCDDYLIHNFYEIIIKICRNIKKEFCVVFKKLLVVWFLEEVIVLR